MGDAMDMEDRAKQVIGDLLDACGTAEDGRSQIDAGRVADAIPKPRRSGRATRSESMRTPIRSRGNPDCARRHPTPALRCRSIGAAAPTLVAPYDGKRADSC
jgi:hypothetical protein